MSTWIPVHPPCLRPVPSRGKYQDFGEKCIATCAAVLPFLTSSPRTAAIGASRSNTCRQRISVKKKSPPPSETKQRQKNFPGIVRFDHDFFRLILNKIIILHVDIPQISCRTGLHSSRVLLIRRWSIWLVEDFSGQKLSVSVFLQSVCAGGW